MAPTYEFEFRKKRWKETVATIHLSFDILLGALIYGVLLFFGFS
jgi:hypothetical protein